MSELVPIADKMKTMKHVLESRKAEIVKALPRATDPARFIRIVLTNFQLAPKLLDCTPTSVYTSVLQAAQWGLELDPVLGMCYLVPYKTTCQLIIGYRGYLELARRHPDMSQVTGRVVREGDELSVEYGLDENLIHRPVFGDEVAPLIGAYVTWRLKSGEKSFVYMSRAEIDKIRSRSRASDSGPWQTDYEQMALKTVIRRAAKLWPTMTELVKAVAVDERADAGVEQGIAETVEATIDAPLALPEHEEPRADVTAAAVLDRIEKLRAGMATVPEPSTGPYVDGIDTSLPLGATAEETSRAEAKREQAKRHEPRKG